jgi:WD40 repeat protein
MELDRPRAVAAAPDPGLAWLRFSSDGRYLAWLGHRPSRSGIVLIDAATGNQLARLKGPRSERVGSLHFDAEGRRLVVSVTDPHGKQTIRWWDLAEAGRPSHSWSFERGLMVAGRSVAVLRDGRTALLDLLTGELRLVLPESDLSDYGAGGIHAATADGRFFAAHTRANRVLVWEMDSGRVADRLEIPMDRTGIVVSPKGSRLAVVDGSGYVSIVDRSSRQPRVLTSGPNRRLRGHSVSFSSDEALLAISIDIVPGGPQPHEIWDVAAARRVAVFPGRSDSGSATFIPGSRSLVVRGGRTPRIWHPVRRAEPDAMAGHAVEAWAAAFSPDGKVLATGSDDTGERRTIKLWDPASGRRLAGWQGHTATVTALAFSPDGKTLASSSLDSGQRVHPNVILWQTTPTSHPRLARLEGHTDRVRSVAFSPDGKTLATVGDDLTARLWDVASRTTRAVLSGHAKPLMCVAFSPDGRMLATGSNDATVRLWDVATGRERAILSDGGNVNAVAFAPDGASLASANENGEIKLWDAAGGDLLRTIPSEADQIRCVAFTPDGRNVLAAGKGKVIRIWDVTTGLESLTLEGHKAQINALAFTPDGSILVSCSHDGAVRLWRAGPHEGAW